MALLISGFEGLAERDFDVYQPACWSNNLHNLDRMRTKARVKLLADQVRSALEGDWAVEASSEIPSIWNGRQVRDQWAYVVRPRAAREPLLALLGAGMNLADRIKDPAEHHQHVLLSVRIDEAHLEVGLRAHARARVDLTNLVERASAEPAVFAERVAALPEGLTIDGAAPTAERLLAAARSTLAGDREWLDVIRRWTRAEALEAGLALQERVHALAEGLTPLFTFMAWSPANDFAGATSALDAFAAKVDARTSTIEAARAAKVSSHEAREAAARDRTAARIADLTAWKKAHPRRPAREEAPRPPAREPAERERDQAEQTRPARPRNAGGEQAERPPQERSARERPTQERPPRERADRERPARERPDRDRPAKARPERATPSKGRPQKARPQPARPRDDRSEPPRPQPAPAAAAQPLVVGDHCRLSRGLLAGKTGQITSIDAKKGLYRVKVGALEVNIASSDLERMG